jgi:SAM-dependent methyltransferase
VTTDHRVRSASHYDAAYFAKWYRSRTHRVKTPREVRRQVDFVVHLTEWTLGRPVRTVLDVGAGEGAWRAPLRRLRPRLHYTGVDPSTYAVGRFGRSRNLLLGDATQLDALPLAPSYDLVVACGMLNYLDARSLRRAVQHMTRRAHGVVYLELFADGDHITGDTSWPPARSASWYRALLRRAGLVSIGLQAYVPAAVARETLTALERR